MADGADHDPRAATATDAAIGVRIRARRAELSVSQEQLAEAIGVTFQQIQKYEKGINRVSASTLIRIAKALKTSPMSLFPPLDGGKAATSTRVEEIVEILSRLDAEGQQTVLSVARTVARQRKRR